VCQEGLNHRKELFTRRVLRIRGLGLNVEFLATHPGRTTEYRLIKRRRLQQVAHLVRGVNELFQRYADELTTPQTDRSLIRSVCPVANRTFDRRIWIGELDRRNFKGRRRSCRCLRLLFWCCSSRCTCRFSRSFYRGRDHSWCRLNRR